MQNVEKLLFHTSDKVTLLDQTLSRLLNLLPGLHFLAKSSFSQNPDTHSNQTPHPGYLITLNVQSGSSSSTIPQTKADNLSLSSTRMLR